jgi:uncharacterized protein (DUF697 family)
MNIPFRMKTVITVAAVAAAAVGVPGAFVGPGADVPMLAGIWTTAAVKLIAHSGRSMEKHLVSKLVAATLASVGAFTGGMKLASTYMTYSTIATVPGVVLNMGANALITWLTLRAMAQVFLEEDLTQSIENLVRSILSVLGGLMNPLD